MMKHFTSDAVILGCSPLVYFHNVVAVVQLNSKERSNGFLTLICLDVKNILSVKTFVLR